jgi:hypothetical protein
MAKIPGLKNPAVSSAAVRSIAVGAIGSPTDASKRKGATRAEVGPAGPKSGLVPEGDVRLTANIRGDLHLKLKILAAQKRTTIGELIEEWIQGWT